MKLKQILLLVILLIAFSAAAQNKIEIYNGGELIYSEYISEIDSITLIKSTNEHK